MKKRILFFCETVTMAHLLRTVELIKSLEQNRYEVQLAVGSISPEIALTLTTHCKIWPLKTSVPSEVFLKHLAKGTLPYSRQKLKEQITEDLFLMDSLKPDVVVGDFRLSLAISARVRKIKYVNITNSTWHPDSGIELQVPDLKIVRWLGEKFSKFIFQAVRPLIFQKLAMPFIQTAREHKVEIPGNLFSIYVDGDYILFADSQSVAPIPNLQSHQFIAGPILTSYPLGQFKTPNMNFQWPRVVVSLGSSGDNSVLPQIIEALGPLPINLFIATNAKIKGFISTTNVHVSPSLPLKELFKDTDLFINNGGSASGYLSLSMGVPFLAIPSNLDQFNFTFAAVKKGAAQRLRIEEVSIKNLTVMVMQMLADPSFRQRAQSISVEIEKEDSSKTFQMILSKALMEDPNL